MTVAELIEELRKYPDDMEVVIFDSREAAYCDVKEVGPADKVLCKPWLEIDY